MPFGESWKMFFRGGHLEDQKYNLHATLSASSVWFQQREKEEFLMFLNREWAAVASGPWLSVKKLKIDKTEGIKNCPGVRIICGGS
jgi:hypothetical protein